MERQQARLRAMWASFGYFLRLADWFVLHYWPPQAEVQPLLDMGFSSEPTTVSPQARLVQGALTPEIRTLLWGAGAGEVPWFKVELKRTGEWLYYIEEHEDTAAWNCSEAELPEVYAAGVDPSVVLDLVEVRRRERAYWPVYRGLEHLAQAAARLVAPGSTGYGYGMYGQATEVAFDVQGGKVWLGFDPEAVAGVPDVACALGLLGRLTPPLRAGDRLRLELVDGEAALFRQG